MSFATPEPEITPQQKDIFHDSVSYLTQIPTPLKTSSTNTSGVLSQSQIQSIKEDISDMEKQIEDLAGQLASLSDPILRKQLDEAVVRKMEAELTLMIFSLPTESSKFGSCKRSSSPGLPTAPVFSTSNHGYLAELALKRKVDEEEIAEPAVKRTKRSLPEDLNEPDLKRKAEEDKLAEDTTRRIKHGSSHAEPANDAQPLPDRSTPSPTNKPTVIFDTLKRDGVVAQPTLKRKADEEEEVFEPIAKRIKYSEPQEQVPKTTLNRKVDEKQEQTAGPALKRMKHSKLNAKSLSMKGRTIIEKAIAASQSSSRVLGHAAAISTPFAPSKTRPRRGDWTCPSCGSSNFKRKTACFRCEFLAMSAGLSGDAMGGNGGETTLKRQADEKEQLNGSALKRNKGGELKAKGAEPTLEDGAGNDGLPKPLLNRQQRKALKRKEAKEAHAEIERKAKELKKQLVKPLNKRKERIKTRDPSKPQSLRRLPAEIREMIFELCDFQWDGRSPALIRALRQDLPLHAEAMRVFFKQDLIFSLNRRNNWSFRGMPVETILTIKKIKIEIQEYRNNSRFSKRKHQPKMIQVPHFTKMKPVCAWPIKVQEVVIEGAFDKVSPLILRNFEHYLAGFQQRLNKITLDLRFTRNCPNRDQITAMTERVNNLLRVEWHQNMVSGSLRRAGRVRRLVWCWEAPDEEGKFLKRIAL